MRSFGVEKYNSQNEQFTRGAPYTLGLAEERIRAWGDIDRGYAIWNTEKKEWTPTRKNNNRRRENLINVQSTGTWDSHDSTGMRGARKGQKKKGKKWLKTFQIWSKASTHPKSSINASKINGTKFTPRHLTVKITKTETLEIIDKGTHIILRVGF